MARGDETLAPALPARLLGSSGTALAAFIALAANQFARFYWLPGIALCIAG